MRRYVIAGQPPSHLDKVAGISTAILLDMFYGCHEYHFDGNFVKIKNKNKRTGYYTRICFPHSGSFMEQSNVIIEAFIIIKKEETKIDNGY